MQHFDAATVRQRLPTAALLDALAQMFRDGCTTPVRHAHTIGVPGSADGSLLLMPAWQIGGYAGTKLVTVFPGNAAHGQPAVNAIYILMNARDGTPLALMDGDALTVRRTAATSALAARFLARKDARHLLVLGSGRIARELALTHYEARPALQSVSVWSRTAARAAALAGELATLGLPARAVTDLPAAAHSADLISAATLSTAPLLERAWIRPGTHIDLVGAFRPGMREADDDLVADARVVADTLAGVLAEADDVRVPLAAGRLAREDIAELGALCRGEASGRSNAQQITLFKSVGAAIEDLAAAMLVQAGG